MKITTKTKLCMVIGDPVDQSLSPLLHNAGYEALNITNKYVFLACKVKSEGISDCIRGIRAMGIHFVSVTMPHKQAVMPFLDDLDDTANQIGAVNTILNSDGKLTGYNTDWLGVVDSIHKLTKIDNKNTLVLGAGGAARAAIFGLVKMGANVTIVNRTIDDAKKLATEFKCKYAEISELDIARDMDIIVNATSIGMRPNENKSLLSRDLFNKNQIILDAVYYPRETVFLKYAKEKDAKIIYGSEMLLHQGMAQFKIYTGHNAPEDSMRKALINQLNI
jgi:shikimate dehydrogenase